MIKNYLTIAIRTLLRHKGYTLINISGLAIGMASCILVLLYIQDELNYDRHHENANQIYRVIRETRNNGKAPRFGPGTSGALAPALLNDFPEVQSAVRVWKKSPWVRHNENAFQQQLCLADENILDVFTFPLLKGNRRTVFREPYSILITEEMARKYFGDENPIGKIVTVEDRHLGGDFKITGILKDIPRKTTLRFDFLISTVAERSIAQTPWTEWEKSSSWRPVQTYVLLPAAHPPERLEQKLPDLMERHMGAEIRQKNTYHLHPLTRTYLYFYEDFGLPRIGRITYIYLLALIGLFILLIACINFMNLATARSAGRAKEVGLRKVVGAHRPQLIRQFLGESTLLACPALILAIGFAWLALPTFNTFTEKQLSLNLADNPLLLLGLLCLVPGVGLVSGSYPAFFLSAFPPAEVLKGTRKTGTKGAWFRKGLVVFQFATSILLMIGTAVVYLQMEYISGKNLGFNKEQMIILPIFGSDRNAQTDFEGPLSKKYGLVKQEFLQHPHILKATASHSVPPWAGQLEGVRPEGAQEQQWQMRILAIDEDFLDTYEIKLTSGRNLSADIATDATEAFILNETAVRQLGWTDPIGKQFEWNWRKGTVIGVVKDFHIRTLHEKIEPFAICMWRPKLNYLSLKTRTDDLPATMAFLKEKWQHLLPHRPFSAWFLDDAFDRAYRAEHTFGQIFATFSILAIFVACLGLFGLASFTAEQRTKEVGIRKVLGASSSSILLLLFREFAGLILVAQLIAWPAAYYLLDQWLENFAYRVDPGPKIFLAGGLLALIIASGTVAYQAIKAATSNPVDALRYE